MYLTAINEHSPFQLGSNTVLACLYYCKFPPAAQPLPRTVEGQIRHRLGLLGNTARCWGPVASKQIPVLLKPMSRELLSLTPQSQAEFADQRAFLVLTPTQALCVFPAQGVCSAAQECTSGNSWPQEDGLLGPVGPCQHRPRVPARLRAGKGEEQCMPPSCWLGFWAPWDGFLGMGHRQGLFRKYSGLPRTIPLQRSYSWREIWWDLGTKFPGISEAFLELTTERWDGRHLKSGLPDVLQIL